jgi:hypothetical protein
MALNLDELNICNTMNSFLDPLCREKRLQIAQAQGDGYRYMSIKCNVSLGFPLLNIDKETLKYLEACEHLVMTGDGLQRSKGLGRVVARDKFKTDKS